MEPPLSFVAPFSPFPASLSIPEKTLTGESSTSTSLNLHRPAPSYAFLSLIVCSDTAAHASTRAPLSLENQLVSASSASL